MLFSCVFSYMHLASHFCVLNEVLDFCLAYHVSVLMVALLYFFRNFIITKKAQRHPYNTRSRKMDNEEGVQEQMKADLSALKDQMASISKVMLKLQKTRIKPRQPPPVQLGKRSWCCSPP